MCMYVPLMIIKICSASNSRQAFIYANNDTTLGCSYASLAREGLTLVIGYYCITVSLEDISSLGCDARRWKIQTNYEFH